MPVPTARLLLFVLIGTLLLSPAAAQETRYFPLDPRQPVGIAARWNAVIHRGLYGYMQPVRMQLPSTGEITFYDGASRQAIPTDGLTPSRMMVGHTYRIRIAAMPEFPGVELFPTIEIIDRLHPPAGREDEFPIPVEILIDEVETALQDRMVIKVIYLEQPDLAAPFEQQERIHVEELPSSRNLLEAADRLGRPVAILRLGGRTPDPQAPEDHFFGTAAPIQVIAPAKTQSE